MRKKPPFSIMLTDGKLDWIMVKPPNDPFAAFQEYHGRKPKGQLAIVVCHPETKWDGAGGFAIPEGEWTPVVVYRKP